MHSRTIKDAMTRVALPPAGLIAGLVAGLVGGSVGGSVGGTVGGTVGGGGGLSVGPPAATRFS